MCVCARAHARLRAYVCVCVYVYVCVVIMMMTMIIGAISTFSGKSSKLVGLLTYLDCNISSTESDVYMRIVKAWTVINRLSIIWKSDISDKMKRNFFQDVAVSVLLYRCTT